MAAQPDADVKSIDSKKADTQLIEESGGSSTSPEQLLQGWPLLKDKSPEEREAINMKVLRKLDYMFLPCVTMMLIMCFLDRMNVTNARLAGMQDDLHMTDVQWSAGVSLFYVGHMISQVPGNVMLASGNPRILLPACMLCWSIVTICMTALNSPGSFIFCRFLIGVFEGPFTPAVSLMTSSWYTKNESPLRMAIWHAGNIVSNVISGLLAAAILTNMKGIAGLTSWQWFILLEGIVSIAVAIGAFWFIPKWPHNTGTYYLTAEESEMAQYRIQVSTGGYVEDEAGGRWSGVILAAKDPFTWLFSVLHFFVIMAQSFKDFFPSIMATFGFGETATYLLQAPPYIVAFISCCVVSWSSGRRLEYFWHMAISMLVALAGTVLSWETTVVPRPRTKRAALIAIANCLSNVTHWFSPYFFLRNQEPRYQTGGGSIIAACGASVIMLVVLKWYIARKNKQLDKEQEETGQYNSWRFVS
ncbi:hypothetical protein LCI18_014917 [Fusarium solani-melongenae]|uniref:Uncharacterized protein n=1 Tax=Fusarium solani subsp. cucurbitae TaxID=2747967 RepID=A0ACD3ZRZ5_FUSSC|nr:hypothetical protein LCI18_014917 [Fusarium solani-melongenae]